MITRLIVTEIVPACIFQEVVVGVVVARARLRSCTIRSLAEMGPEVQLVERSLVVRHREVGVEIVAGVAVGAGLAAEAGVEEAGVVVPLALAVAESVPVVGGNNNIGTIW